MLCQKHGGLAREGITWWTKIRRAHNELSWDQGEAKDLRARITSTTTILDAFKSELDRSHQERQAITGWLSTLKFPLSKTSS